MIKLIASDMDGTLLDSNSKIPDEMHSLLDELDKIDVPFVAASGRSLHSIENTFGDLAKRICIVSDNGAVVKHKGDIIHSSVIAPEDWKRIALDCLKAKETSVVLVGIDGAFRISANPEHDQILGGYFTNAKEVASLDEINTDIIKITLLSIDHTKENYDTFLYPKYKDEFSVVFGGAVWIDFMNKNIDKGNGLQALLDKYEVSPSEVMAFGDYHNDIEMLKLASHSYAVENAHDDVKDIAKTIIGTNTDNAVVKTIMATLKLKL